MITLMTQENAGGLMNHLATFNRYRCQSMIIKGDQESALWPVSFRLVASYQKLILGEFLAVGSFNQAKAEIYNDESSSWTSIPDYPYSGKKSNTLLTFVQTCFCIDFTKEVNWLTLHQFILTKLTTYLVEEAQQLTTRKISVGWMQ